MDFGIFKEFLLFLENSHSNVHRVCGRTMVNTYSPVFRWKGKIGGYQPETVGMPYLIAGATDAGRYYNVLRFTPFLITKEDFESTPGKFKHNGKVLNGIY